MVERKLRAGPKHTGLVSSKKRVSKPASLRAADLSRFEEDAGDYHSSGDEEASGSGTKLRINEKAYLNDASGTTAIPGREEDAREGELEEEEAAQDADAEDSVGSSDEESSGGEGTASRPGNPAFSRAFTKIMQGRITDDAPGPILAARKQLLARKLEKEEEEEHFAKRAAKKERLQAREVGHRGVPKHSDPAERLLLKVATKGDAASMSRAAFLSELRGAAAVTANRQQPQQEQQQPLQSEGAKGDGGWAVLQPDFMHGPSKASTWDHPQDEEENEDAMALGGGSSSDDS
eukprot:jgi/Mesen1/4082/ME000214S03265